MTAQLQLFTIAPATQRRVVEEFIVSPEDFAPLRGKGYASLVFQCAEAAQKAIDKLVAAEQDGRLALVTARHLRKLGRNGNAWYGYERAQEVDTLQKVLWRLDHLEEQCKFRYGVLQSIALNYAREGKVSKLRSWWAKFKCRKEGYGGGACTIVEAETEDQVRKLMEAWCASEFALADDGDGYVAKRSSVSAPDRYDLVVTRYKAKSRRGK